MDKVNEVIKDWKEHINYPGRITFNIQIDSSDFNIRER